MLLRRLTLELTNKADHHRVFHIEPLGYKYGIESGESFKLVFVSGENLEIFMTDNDAEIIFSLENFDHLEVSVSLNTEEIFDGHNILYN